MKYLQQLIVASVIACVGLAFTAPTTAVAASKKCHWDKKKGRMICQRAPP